MPTKDPTPPVLRHHPKARAVGGDDHRLAPERGELMRLQGACTQSSRSSFLAGSVCALVRNARASVSAFSSPGTGAGSSASQFAN